MSKIFLYHATCQMGKLCDQREYKQLAKEGWVGSASQLNFAEIQEANEAMSESEVVPDIGGILLSDCSDDELLAEAEARGLKGSSEEDEPLINRFVQDPTSLSKGDLVDLGSDYGLDISKKKKPATMIAEIAEAIEAAKGSSEED